VEHHRNRLTVLIALLLIAAVLLSKHASAESSAVTQFDSHTSEVSVVDVLAVYTPEAEALAGGPNRLAELLSTWAASVDAMYSRSQSNTKIHLVGVVPIEESEAVSLEDNLAQVTARSDGHFDRVHELRDQYRADLVTLFVKTMGPDSNNSLCGLAWFGATSERMAANHEAYMASGFSVVSINNTCSPETWAHELGHNFGCNHDIDHAVAPDGSGYDYAFGYRFTGNDGVFYRTIMAAQPAESTGYFSNPNLIFKGHALGDNNANNAQVISNSSPIIAEYYSGSGPDFVPPDGTDTPPSDPQSVTSVSLKGSVKFGHKHATVRLRGIAYAQDKLIDGAAMVVNFAAKKSDTEITVAGPYSTSGGEAQFIIKKAKPGYYRVCVATLCSTRRLHVSK